MILGIGGLGVANAARKTVAKKTAAVSEPDRDLIPTLTGIGSLLESNYVKGPKGNAIRQDYPYLWLKPKTMRSYITATLKNPKGNVIQIEQSGTKDNPWMDIVRLELVKMQNGKKVPMQKGSYTVILRGDRAGEAQTITDKFDII